MSEENADAVEKLTHARSLVSQLLSNIASRPPRNRAAPNKNSKQQVLVGACDRCRKLKLKCDNPNPIGMTETSDMDPCSRCTAGQVPCVYSVHEKRGRKKSPHSTVIMLEDVFYELEDAISAMGGFKRTREDNSTLYYTIREERKKSPEAGRPNPKVDKKPLLSYVEHLETPLQVLNQVEDGPANKKIRLDPTSYLQYGLHTWNSDVASGLDPITMGLITEEDAERLLKFYFDNLWMYFWHLDPELHTLAFLRSTSPFLLTAACASASLFCPKSGHLVEPLHDHAARQATLVIQNGYRSVQVIQALVFMTHWSTPGGRWSQDRSWMWLGMALRIATEIRLNKQIDPSILDGRDENELRLKELDCTKTWLLLYCSEIAMSILTGRLSYFYGVKTIRGLPDDTSLLRADTPFSLKNLYATARLRNILMLAHATDTEKTTRKAFISKWEGQLEQWSRDNSDCAQFVQVMYINTRIMLSLFSLRFEGSSSPVFEACMKLSVESAKLSSTWDNETYLYSNNYCVINFAYGATLLLALFRMNNNRLSPDITEDTALYLCSRVAITLSNIGQRHIHRPSLASHIAARLYKLIEQCRLSSSRAQSRASSPMPKDERIPFLTDDINIENTDLKSLLSDSTLLNLDSISPDSINSTAYTSSMDLEHLPTIDYSALIDTSLSLPLFDFESMFNL